MIALVIGLLVIIIVLLFYAVEIADQRDQLFELLQYEVNSRDGDGAGTDQRQDVTKPDMPTIPQPAPMRKGQTFKSLFFGGKDVP